MLKRTRDYSQWPDVTALTREALQNENLFEDSGPQWFIGKAQRPAQTAGQAQGEREKIIKRVRRDAPDDLAAQAIADRLDSCMPDQRCMSGGCTECGRAYARWFVASTVALLGDME
ncbi:hypothetical protein MAE02_54790 [Microvirga aerophila]|uniref:Uncharacterized protein n=1 Tax=Microvirga aerophila TaxID=670291 RepID=A0A512C0Q5_9HYPH|nr:hypothetical protein MAE02_54790 [Microvirga aerophila]